MGVYWIPVSLGHPDLIPGPSATVNAGGPFLWKGFHMLVLSRQRNESIMIGDDIEIVIDDIRGNKVRIGVIAPHRIPVHRKEVYDSIKNQDGCDHVWVPGTKLFSKVCSRCGKRLS